MWAWVMLQRPKDSSTRSLCSLGRNDKKETASLGMTEEGTAARAPNVRAGRTTIALFKILQVTARAT